MRKYVFSFLLTVAGMLERGPEEDVMLIYLNTAGATIVRAWNTLSPSFRSIAGCTRTAGGKSHCEERAGRWVSLLLCLGASFKLRSSLNPHLTHTTAALMSCSCLGFYPIDPSPNPEPCVYETRIDTELWTNNTTQAMLGIQDRCHAWLVTWSW